MRIGIIQTALALLLINVALHLILRSLAQPHGVKNIAHRTAAGLAPENTLLGIQTAAAHTTFVELDVRRTKDNVLVLLHDDHIDRTTSGQGRVSNLTWEALQHFEVDIGSNLTTTPPERIPSFRDALSTSAGVGITLVVELKDPVAYPEIERQVSQLIAKHPNPIIVISFDEVALNRVKQALPTTRTGRLSIYPIANPSTPYAVESIFWPSVLLDPTLIYRLHQRNQEVWVWTVNNPHLMRLLIWLGVDGITTDYPDRLKQLVP